MKLQCHSLMPVLLNGGEASSPEIMPRARCHSLMPVLLNGGNGDIVDSDESIGATR